MTVSPTARLKADTYHYASQPAGATAGQDWMELWGKQWGAFSEFAGSHRRDRHSAAPPLFL